MVELRVLSSQLYEVLMFQRLSPAAPVHLSGCVLAVIYRLRVLPETPRDPLTCGGKLAVVGAVPYRLPDQVISGYVPLPAGKLPASMVTVGAALKVTSPLTLSGASEELGM